jgi:hypothetical protein
MKTFVVSALNIILVSILFCPMVMAVPTMPADLQIVQPDPSLPKELSAFWGKWEGLDPTVKWFLIVEKIDEEKASLYWWRGGPTEQMAAYTERWYPRTQANVIKECGKYKLVWRGMYGKTELTSKGEYLESSSPAGTLRLKRVP